jgi:vacuolar protein sorting-associated protein 8
VFYAQVCCIEPLVIEQSSHPASGALLFAMASLTKVLVVGLRPELLVYFSHQLTGSSSTFPLVAWQCVSIRVSETVRVNDPVLAFARDCTIFFVHVGISS